MGVLGEHIEAAFKKIDWEEQHGFGGGGIPGASEGWKWRKDLPSAEKGAQQAEAEVRRIADCIAKLMDGYDEANAERKRIGDDIIAKRKALGDEEAAVLAGEGDARKVQSAARELDKAEENATIKRQRLRAKANSLLEKANAHVRGYWEAVFVHAAAMDNVAVLRMEATRDAVNKATAEYDDARQHRERVRIIGVTHSNNAHYKPDAKRIITEARRFAKGGTY